MNIDKKKRLERTGWAVGSATDFLQLSQEEANFIELKLALAVGIREVRERNGLTQTEVAARLGSSQSRVAKMEAGDRSVSLDLWSNHCCASGPAQPQSPSGYGADHQEALTNLRFSTSTLSAANEVVPWLAATGELAYSPQQSPPERDYFFQYSWIVAGILRQGANKRRHYWFGNPSKEVPNVRLLFRFWNVARQDGHDPLFLSN